MKMQLTLNGAGWITVVAMAALAMGGCNRSNLSPKVAAEELQKSFAKADSTVKQEVAQAGAALQAGDYTQALIAMDRAAQLQPVDAAQKKRWDCSFNRHVWPCSRIPSSILPSFTRPRPI